MNILDGSWDCKVFQIGANKGQIMNVSIGSMGTEVLGVAKSNAAAAAEYCPPPDPILVGRRQRGPSNQISMRQIFKYILRRLIYFYLN